MNNMKFLIIISLFSFCLTIQAQETKVLFIGNSYTGYNNLANLVEEVAFSAGDTLVYDTHIVGGATLNMHANSATAQTKIKSGDWDYVVIQAQSQEPSFPIGQVETQTFPYAQQLCDSIRAANECSIPLFYMTWGRENGDQNNCANWPPVCTYEGMDSLLNLRYRMMAELNEGYVAPVGAVWKHIRENHPIIDLYANDGSHPSPTGSYAAACTFYSIIFEKDPNLIQFNYNVSDSIAALIKEAVSVTVFESFDTWYVGDYDPQADFIFEQSEDTLFFNNQAEYFDSLYWDFGDGTFSYELNPMHDYPDTNATYTATLTAFNCGKMDVFSSEITVSSFIDNDMDGFYEEEDCNDEDANINPNAIDIPNNGIDENCDGEDLMNSINRLNNINIHIYPNPTMSTLFVDYNERAELEISLYTQSGKLLYRRNNIKEVPLYNYEEGMYFLEIMNLETNDRLIEKFVLVK